MRLVFAGTPEVAVPALDAIAASRHELVAVLTRPDAPAGRGRRLTRSPVAAWADERGLEVLTPARPREPEFLDRLRAIGPDCVPVVAYGALVPPAALDIPRYGWVNLHFSLLPAWRGAAPVQHAVLHGDEVTGASVFQLEEGLDTGPVYGTLTERVRPTDTAGELLDRLAVAGARLLVQALDGIADGVLEPVPQAHEGVSLAPKLSVEDARVRWDDPAFAVDRRVRACTPAPGAWTTLRGERLKLGPVAPVAPVASAGGPGAPAGGFGAPAAAPDPASGPRPGPGELLVRRGAVLVGTGTDPVVLGSVAPAGRKPMPADAWARGARVSDGDRFQ
jgi:methionyl-tRNA formyltransferase